MNADEFAALKEGDRIDNPMTKSAGTVTGLTRDRRGLLDGVLVQWDGTSPQHARAFSKQTTAWMHWNKIAAMLATAIVLACTPRPTYAYGEWLRSMPPPYRNLGHSYRYHYRNWQGPTLPYAHRGYRGWRGNNYPWAGRGWWY